jgi:hypothetical protein
MTWWVWRDGGGAVKGCFRARQPGYAEEELADSHPDVMAFLAPRPPIDLSNLDNLERTLKAQALVFRDYSNALKSEVRGVAVLLVQKGTFTANEANGLLAYDGSGTGDSKTIQDLKDDFAEKYVSLR